MSRIKNLSRSGWFVVGSIAALLLVPTTAAALTSSVIIKGGANPGQAGVSTAGQVLTAPASPANYFATGDVTVTANPSTVALASPPSGDAVVLTSAEVAFNSVPSVGGSHYIQLEVGNTSCSLFSVSAYAHDIWPSSVGETDLQFNPGLVIPSGDALCAFEVGIGTQVATIGYMIPASAA
jgi:hypothetical protein